MTQLPGCTNPAHSGGFGRYCSDSCSPPAENSEAPGASGADDGRGVCTLTIDTHRLRNVWLPSYAKSVTAARHLDKLDTAARRRRSPSQPALWHAYWVVSRDVERLVDKILTRGGLLLIGGVL